MNYGTSNISKALNDIKEAKVNLYPTIDSYEVDWRLLNKKRAFEKKYDLYLEICSDEIAEEEFERVEYSKIRFGLIAYTNYLWHIIAYGLYHWEGCKEHYKRGNVTTIRYTDILRKLNKKKKKCGLNIQHLSQLKYERHELIHSIRGGNATYVIDNAEEIYKILEVLEDLLKCYIDHSVIILHPDEIEEFEECMREYKELFKTDIDNLFCKRYRYF